MSSTSPSSGHDDSAMPLRRPVSDAKSLAHRFGDGYSITVPPPPPNLSLPAYMDVRADSTIRSVDNDNSQPSTARHLASDDTSSFSDSFDDSLMSSHLSSTSSGSSRSRRSRQRQKKGLDASRQIPTTPQAQELPEHDWDSPANHIILSQASSGYEATVAASSSTPWAGALSGTRLSL
eukprot:TRINITY_DN26157_c0_g1_i4.p1 TRINITY_DN26157_c0_g1~~TRINITY_DN26157_c0_g1_i4.p1  ORF type:complete len:178 (-),score=11.14 TRINITY_DN26157_c0_g1_i4:199-732(-)